jgi:uncharacterized protein (DUF433 family)
MKKDKPMPVRIYRYGYEYVRLPRSIMQGAKTEMVIDPNIQWGQPTVRGTRLPLESLGGYIRAGDSIEQVALMFEITEDAVKEAIEYCQSKPESK